MTSAPEEAIKTANAPTASASSNDKQNIRVNTVSPAAIATDMIDRFAGKEGSARDALIALHPVGRPGKSEEVATAVLYLCSDAAKFTTGTSLKVDGGWLVPSDGYPGKVARDRVRSRFAKPMLRRASSYKCRNCRISSPI